MTTREFSDAFDTLLNSYNTQAQFGEQSSRSEITLDEYEKSVFLTQAQDIIVKSYFDRTLNNQGQGFDDSTRRQVDFSSLIKIAKFSSRNSDLKHFEVLDKLYDRRGILVNLGINNRILFILNEKLETGINNSNKETYVVVPINYKEYDREMSKVYSQPLKKQAWRLFSNSSTGYDINSEIIPIFDKVPMHLYAKEIYMLTFSGDSEDRTYEWEPTDMSNWDNIYPDPDNIMGVVNNIGELPEPSKELYDNYGSLIYIVGYTLFAGYEADYTVRYVERPSPIILTNLPPNLEIDGTNKESPCKLNPILHMDILNKAVELAIISRGNYADAFRNNEHKS